MSLMDSQITPYLLLITIFAVMLGFFRKMLWKVIIILLVEAAIFALFPQLLAKFVDLVLALHGALG